MLTALFIYMLVGTWYILLTSKEDTQTDIYYQTTTCGGVETTEIIKK